MTKPAYDATDCGVAMMSETAFTIRIKQPYGMSSNMNPAPLGNGYVVYSGGYAIFLRPAP